MLENFSIINWIVKHGLKTEDGKPYSFKSHKFMYEPLQVLSRTLQDVVVYKAAQVGFSTAVILATFWITKNKRKNIIYTLPTANDVKDFAGGKINRIIAQNPILGQWVKEHDTIEQKAVGDNIIYYRGTWTSKAAMMVTSSLNAYDEIDTSDQKVIEQYETRLQGQTEKTRWYFSHPSVPGNGVSKYWGKSDQRHWFITCPHCKEEQYLDFPESFDLEAKEYVCKECRGVLKDEVRINGRWVQKYKDKEMVGFWIPLWICPWVPAKEIIKLHDDKSAEYFTNKVAGLPYVGSGNKPQLSMITKNLTSDPNLQEDRVIIGVDTGIKLHYVMGNKKGLFHYDTVDSYDDIERLLLRYPNSIAVFDQGGDLIGSRKLREKYVGRVFLCHYSVDRKTYQLIRWGKEKEEGNVVVDRNRTIQLLLDEFNDGKVPLQGTEEDWWDYWLHWNNIYRVQEENKLGVIERKWERSGEDHFVHASVYWRVGMNRFGGEKGGIIAGKQTKFRTAPTVAPNQTIPATNPKQLFDFNNKFD